MTRISTPTYTQESRILDLRSRLQVSMPQMQFAHAAQLTANETMRDRVVGLASSTFNFNESCTDIAVTSTNGDKLTRQSYLYIPYLPGTPMQATMTAAMATSKPNVSQRVGLFDDLNGAFFEDDGTGMGVVRRSSVTGATVDERVAQADWNVDPLDGTGPSGLTFDAWDTFILYAVDMLWQGAVGLRFGLILGFDFLPVHEIRATDLGLRVPFFGKPSLPARYEIENTSASSGATVMKTGCIDVIGQGANRLVGLDWAVSNGAQTVSVSTTEVPVLAVRLRTTVGGNQVRRTLRLLSTRLYAADQPVVGRIVVVHSPDSLAGGTWVNVDTDHSAIEYNLGQPTVTGGQSHTIDYIYAPATSGGAVESPTTTSTDFRFDDTHSLATMSIDGLTSDVFIIYARTIAGTTDVSAIMKLLEFD